MGRSLVVYTQPFQRNQSSSTLSMQRLPAELTDIIIHHSGRPTLKVCSLVCRNWLPASRLHLFGSVFVYRSNIRSFVELLASRSSTIASHVHTLHINVLVFDAIAPHLDGFVALKLMSLQGKKWVPVGEKSLSRVFGRIGNMELTSVYCNLEISWFSLTFTLGENGPSSFSSTLRVFRAPSHPSSWLPVVVQLPSVGEVDLRSILQTHLPTVQAVLMSGGEFIHTIKLRFPNGPSGLALISDRVDLSHNTNLRSLYITLNFIDSGEIAHHGSLLKIIQRISSPFFSHITIDAEVQSLADLTWLDCEKVADELNRPRFSELQKVCIKIECPSDKKDGVMAWVRKEMSCLDTRGILTVDRRDH